MGRVGLSKYRNCPEEALQNIKTTPGLFLYGGASVSLNELIKLCFDFRKWAMSYHEDLLAM